MFVASNAFITTRTRRENSRGNCHSITSSSFFLQGFVTTSMWPFYEWWWRSSLLELPQGLQPRESVKETGKKLNVSKSILSKYQTRTVQTKPIPITLLERLSARLQASQQYVSDSLSNYYQMLGLTDKQALYWQEKMNCTSLSW